MLPDREPGMELAFPTDNQRTRCRPRWLLIEDELSTASDLGSRRGGDRGAGDTYGAGRGPAPRTHQGDATRRPQQARPDRRGPRRGAADDGAFAAADGAPG